MDFARAASARASVRLGSSISAVGRPCLVLHLIGFLPASLSLGLIRSNLGLQPHFGFFFMSSSLALAASSSLALVTPASLDAACLRFMYYVDVFLSVLPATVHSLRPSLLSFFLSLVLGPTLRNLVCPANQNCYFF